MKTSLIFLESSAKKKTIQGILGQEFYIVATRGHICNLKNSGDYNLGVNLKTFIPSYEVLLDKKKNLNFWKKLIKENEFQNIFLATDPDREGEGIAKEIVEQLHLKENQHKRLVFYEITPYAIREALSNPIKLDNHLVESQTSRQVLDKMIGFCISPLLYKKVKALSAGRVQSVVLKMIIERELNIKEYEKKDKKYFVEGEGTSSKKKTIKVKQVTDDGSIVIYNSQEEAFKKIENLSLNLEFFKKKEEIKSYPSRNPFTTSSLLSEARSILGFSIGQTTKIAQKLYEGVFIKEENISIGLITYPRTDSLRINSNFTKSVYNYVEKEWGKEYCNFQPTWKNLKTKHSQEAHESIHPTSLNREPKKLKTSLNCDEYKLYELIFENSLICLMSFAEIKKKSYLFKTEDNYFSFVENLVNFLGFLIVNPKRYFSIYNIKEKDSLDDSSVLKINKWEITEYTLGKPTRYNEGTLVKELEKLGIGRPSTYNSFGTILLKRRYVYLNEKRQFVPSKLGYDVSDWLQKYFSTIINQEYTASLEDELDKISKGENDYFNFIKGFWKEFSKTFKTLE